jgi:predicted nuclease with TOPRIM domain
MGLTKKMTQNQRLEVALARLEERVEALQDDIKELKTDVTRLNATADRWKGAFWLMMGVGGIVGVLANLTINWFK